MELIQSANAVILDLGIATVKDGTPAHVRSAFSLLTRFNSSPVDVWDSRPPMEFKIWITDAKVGKISFSKFVQLMANRASVAEHRYGPARHEQDYLLRLQDKLELYRATGNTEFLVDAANYCWLEFFKPLHPNAHFASVDAAGRGRGQRG